MTTLRYLLGLVAILSVVSVSAATYGKPYQPQQRGSRYAMNYSQMPTQSMSTFNASMMNSGSALPMAAVTGTTSADDYTSPSSRPRRVGENEGLETGETPIEPEEPDVPLGDEVLPLMLLAMLYAGWVAIRRKKAAKR